MLLAAAGVRLTPNAVTTHTLAGQDCCGTGSASARSRGIRITRKLCCTSIIDGAPISVPRKRQSGRTRAAHSNQYPFNACPQPTSTKAVPGRSALTIARTWARLLGGTTVEEQCCDDNDDDGFVATAGQGAGAGIRARRERLV